MVGLIIQAVPGALVNQKLSKLIYFKGQLYTKLNHKWFASPELFYEEKYQLQILILTFKSNYLWAVFTRIAGSNRMGANVKYYRTNFVYKQKRFFELCKAENGNKLHPNSYCYLLHTLLRSFLLDIQRSK